MGGRGSGSGMNSGGSRGASSNTFQSEYGLPNVGTRELVTTIGGSTTRGTVIPTVDDVQAYFDTGRFDGFGSNMYAKRTMNMMIAKDMNGRGFEMQMSDDNRLLLPDGDTGKAITYSRRNGKWVARVSSSSGTRERGGMKGALGRAGRTRRQ